MKRPKFISTDEATLINEFVSTSEKRAIAMKNHKGPELINAIVRGDRSNEKILSDLIKKAEKNKAKELMKDGDHV